MVMELVVELLKLTILAGLAIAGVLVITIWKRNQTIKVTYIRFVIQAAALAAVYYLFTFTVRPLYIVVFLLIMSIVLGRFFCGWICPFGLYMDVLTLIRKALKIRYRIIPDRLNKLLHNLRYALVLLFLALAPVLYIIDPPSTSETFKLMALGLAGVFEQMYLAPRCRC